MTVTLTKGRQTVRIMTAERLVIKDFDPFGDGFQGLPYRERCEDPERFAQEWITSYVTDGWSVVSR